MPYIHKQVHNKLRRLRLQYILTVVSAILFLIVIYLPFQRLLQDGRQFAWTCFSIFLSSYVIYETGRLLSRNHSLKNNYLFSSLGIGNILTIFRGIFIGVAGGFLVLPATVHLVRWIPGLLYLLAILLDVFDGYFARKQNQVSVMGQRLDTEIDAFGILVSASLGIHYGQIPAWYILIGLAYYFFCYGKGYRSVKGEPVINLPGSTHGPLLAGIQMGFLSMSIFPVFSVRVTMIAGYVFGIPFLIMFYRDWLIVSNKYKGYLSQFKKRYSILRHLVQSFLLPLFRVMALALGIYLIFSEQPLFISDVQNFFTINNVSFAVEIWEICFLIALICIGLGVFHRIASLAIMGLIGVVMPTSSIPVYSVILLVLSGIMLQTGPGRYALFNWDERLFIRGVSQKEQDSI